MQAGTPRVAYTVEKEIRGVAIRDTWVALYGLEVLRCTNTPSFSPLVPVEEGDEIAGGAMNHRIGLAGNLDDSVDDALEYTEDGDYDEMIANVMEDDLDEDMGEDHDHDHEGDECDDQIHEGPVFDPASLGLREINNLAHFGVSSHKPGNGVDELLSDDLDKYWQ